ncbi:hypothetical protein [Fischerella sp. FACHB-380]|uniref:hypothetical protein n=1 Tax=Fischerella sp. FACHB-380 TaxID=2692799 RepID=UPI001A7EE680|nr:hypothetical protein [Fischerella sp. FACHB-380]
MQRQIFLSNIQITKNKGFGHFNLAAYWKRQYSQKIEKEPWFLLTNLDNLEEVIKIYRHRMGIERSRRHSASEQCLKIVKPGL